MYQPYPGSSQPPSEPPRSSAPPSVLRAAQVMYVGAAASLIGIAVDFTALGAIKDQIKKRSPSLTPSQLTTVQHVEVGALIAAGLLAAALWIWMAQSCKAGKSWARVVSTVLFGIDTVAQVVGATSGPSGLGRLYALLVWLIGLAAVILLWRRPSSDYFRAAPRY